MAIILPFSAEGLAPFGLGVIRKEGAPQRIKIHELDVVRANVFASLENAKNLNAQFIDFPDQAWLVSKNDAEHLLFGRIEGAPATVETLSGEVHLHYEHMTCFANSSLEAFACCFNRLHAVISASKSRIQHRRLTGIQTTAEDEAQAAQEIAGLRDLLKAVDRPAFDRLFREDEPASDENEETFWDVMLCTLEDRRMAFLPDPSFYFVSGRMVPSY